MHFCMILVSSHIKFKLNLIYSIIIIAFADAINFYEEIQKIQKIK